MNIKYGQIINYIERNDNMRNEDRKVMLESLYDIRKIEIPSDVSTDIITIGSEKQSLFKDKMQKQVERTFKAYEASHPDVIPFKALGCEDWLIDIDNDGVIRLTKKLTGALSKSLHAYDDTAKFYYYRNMAIGIAVHDYTRADSGYLWYFIPGKGLAEAHELYYRCSAYYSEYGVTQYLLKYLGEMSKM